MATNTKKFIPFVLLIVIASVAGGFFMVRSKGAEDGSQRISRGQEGGFSMNGIEGSIQDLAVGELITVFGETNQDGSLTASVIRLGESTAPTYDPQQARPEDFSFTQPRDGEFSPRGGFGGGQFREFRGGEGQTAMRGAAPTIVSGELIDITDSILTVKTAESGSRLVLYSDATSIFLNESDTTPKE